MFIFRNKPYQAHIDSMLCLWCFFTFNCVKCIYFATLQLQQRLKTLPRKHSWCTLVISSSAYCSREKQISGRREICSGKSLTASVMTWPHKRIEENRSFAASQMAVPGSLWRWETTARAIEKIKCSAWVQVIFACFSQPFFLKKKKCCHFLLGHLLFFVRALWEN